MILLKQHASRFMFIFITFWKIYLKVKYCEMNKGSNLHTYGTYNPHKLPKRDQNMQHSPYCNSHTEVIWRSYYNLCCYLRYTLSKSL
jgi:hypothetical protein